MKNIRKFVILLLLLLMGCLTDDKSNANPVVAQSTITANEVYEDIIANQIKDNKDNRPAYWEEKYKGKIFIIKGVATNLRHSSLDLSYNIQMNVSIFDAIWIEVTKIKPDDVKKNFGHIAKGDTISAIVTGSDKIFHFHFVKFE